jgi:hypothetical protein
MEWTFGLALSWSSSFYAAIAHLFDRWPIYLFTISHLQLPRFVLANDPCTGLRA